MSDRLIAPPPSLTPSELRAIGLARYGTTRFVAAMSRDTGIPLRTLYRHVELGTDKRLAVEKIRGLVNRCPGGSTAE